MEYSVTTPHGIFPRNHSFRDRLQGRLRHSGQGGLHLMVEWEILDSHDLAALYAAAFLIPFCAAYLLMRLAGWWRGL